MHSDTMKFTSFSFLLFLLLNDEFLCHPTIPDEDFIHDSEFFMQDPEVRKNLTYGSPVLPRHLYDLKIDPRQVTGRQFPISPNLNSVLPPGLTFNGYNPVALEASVLQMEKCATQLGGYRDPDLGVMKLEPNLFCTPSTARFIPGLTCCAPQPPDQFAIRLLLFKPRTSRVTELNFRSKTRPITLPDHGRIVYLIHGWLDNVTDSKWVQPVARAFNDRGAHVILVDWKFGNSDYFQAASNCRTVGAVVGLTIINWRVRNFLLCIQILILADFRSRTGLWSSVTASELRVQEKQENLPGSVVF